MFLLTLSRFHTLGRIYIAGLEQVNAQVYSDLCFCLHLFC